jgi:cadmium resistance protein CadD (predicted permease)
MDTAVSYLISIGLIAFGAWVVFAAAEASSGSVWTILGLMPVAVGLFSLVAEMRGGNAGY